VSEVSTIGQADGPKVVLGNATGWPSLQSMLGLVVTPFYL
jgi:hypothetical protein